MDGINYNKYLEILKTCLIPLFGGGEGESMALYYIDACRDKNIQISEEQFYIDIEKLKKGIPVQYVVGLSFFYGHTFYVTQNVLIPRSETEELVYWAVTDFKDRNDVSVLDIGSGSGCIMISSLLELKSSKGLAWDISRSALDCLNLNIKKHNVTASSVLVDVLNYDWKNHKQKVDIVFCNPPYILKDEESRMGQNVLENEPHIALFVDGNDPLVFYKTIIDNISYLVKPLGGLYFETSDLYHKELEAYVKTKELNYEFRKDMQGAWRMLKLGLV